MHFLLRWFPRRATLRPYGGMWKDLKMRKQDSLVFKWDPKQDLRVNIDSWWRISALRLVFSVTCRTVRSSSSKNWNWKLPTIKHEKNPLDRFSVPFQHFDRALPAGHFYSRLPAGLKLCRLSRGQMTTPFLLFWSLQANALRRDHRIGGDSHAWLSINELFHRQIIPRLF